MGSPSKEALAIYPALEWNDHQRNLEQAFGLRPPEADAPYRALQSDEPLDLTPYVEDGTLPMTAEEAEQFRKLLFNAWWMPGPIS